MSNIFNIAEERLRLINEIEAAEGELTPEMEEAFTINLEEAASKLDAYAYVIKLKESEIQLAEDEIETYKVRIAARKSTITRLKDTMLVAVKLFGTDKKPNKDGIINKEFNTEHHKLYTQTAKKLVDEDNISITADNFDDDRYNRYALTRKLTVDEITRVKDMLFMEFGLALTGLEVKRDVDTAQLKSDLNDGVVISTAQLELDETGINTKLIDSSIPTVDAYIILNDTIRIK